MFVKWVNSVTTFGMYLYYVLPPLDYSGTSHLFRLITNLRDNAQNIGPILMSHRNLQRELRGSPTIRFVGCSLRVSSDLRRYTLCLSLGPGWRLVPYPTFIFSMELRTLWLRWFSSMMKYWSSSLLGSDRVNGCSSLSFFSNNNIGNVFIALPPGHWLEFRLTHPNFLDKVSDVFPRFIGETMVYCLEQPRVWQEYTGNAFRLLLKDPLV